MDMHLKDYNTLQNLKAMSAGDDVGRIGTCIECHQRKLITLEWNRGTNRDGNQYSIYL